MTTVLGYGLMLFYLLLLLGMALVDVYKNPAQKEVGRHIAWLGLGGFVLCVLLLIVRSIP